MNIKKHLNPNIPKPEHKENPDVEHLITPEQLHPIRQKMIKPYEHVPNAHLNRMYGTLRVADSWIYTIDTYAKGSLTTVSATLVQSSATVTPTLPETRLSRWPGAVSMYMAIRSFSFAPSTASFATLGSIDLYYQDAIGGATIPLGSAINSNGIALVDLAYLIPTPITDPGLLSNVIGQVQATLSSGATVGTYVWQIGFSFAYLLPTNKPYDVQHIEELYDGHPGPTQHVHS